MKTTIRNAVHRARVALANFKFARPIDPAPFPEQESVLGAPKGWREEVHGKCDGLPVRVMEENGCRVFLSCWRARFYDRLRFLVTGKLWLRVVSAGQPPVSVCIGGEYFVRMPGEPNENHN